MAIQTHRGNCNTCVNYEFAFHKHNAVTSHDTGQLLNVQHFPLKCIFEILAGYLSKSVTALLCQSAPAHKGYFASTCLKFLPQQGPKMPLESAGECTHMRAKEQQKQMFHVNGNILGRVYREGALGSCGRVLLGAEESREMDGRREDFRFLADTG